MKKYEEHLDKYPWEILNKSKGKEKEVNEKGLKSLNKTNKEMHK